MFGLFKKEIKVISPMDGTVVSLEMVPDQAFAQKMVGDGVAITDLQGNIACAPIDGRVSLIFRTNHAFAIKTQEDIDVLVHIGLDTVELNGEGFERLVEEGDVVKAGQPIIRFDPAVIVNSGRSLCSPVIITTMENIGKLSVGLGGKVTAGQEVLFSYKKK